MTLEERIAEAVRSVIGDNPLVPGELGQAARAVVAVLPTADVSDAEIEAALSVDLSAFPDFGAINRALVANVRALLDAQAAAHAAEVEALRAELDRVRRGSELGWSSFYAMKERAEAAEAERDAYRARIDAVRALCDLAPDLHGSMVWTLACDVLAALDGA